MSSKTTELVEGKSGDCAATNNALEQCSHELTNPDAKMVHSEPSPSAGRILAGFSVDSKTASEATITTASSALLVGLGGAGIEAAKIGTGRMALTIFERPLQVMSMVCLGADPKVVPEITRKLLSEPYGARVLSAGLKAGTYGAAVGLTAYGLYRGYEYLTSEKP